LIPNWDWDHRCTRGERVNQFFIKAWGPGFWQKSKRPPPPLFHGFHCIFNFC
jgi:hypothetical protein